MQELTLSEVEEVNGGNAVVTVVLGIIANALYDLGKTIASDKGTGNDQTPTNTDPMGNVQGPNR